MGIHWKSVVRAFASSGASISAHLVCFFLIAVAFNGLLELRRWQAEYAISTHWSEWIIQNSGGATWAPEVAAAVRDLATEPGVDGKNRVSRERKFTSIEALQTAVRSAVLKRSDASVAGLAEKRKEIAGIQKMSRERTDILDGRIRVNVDRLDQIDRQMPVSDEKKEQELARTRQHLTSTISALSLERAAVERSEKRVERLQAEIDREERALGALIERHAPYARSSDVWLALLTASSEHLLRIGAPDDPLHVVFDLTWFLLHGIIVVLTCVIFVPWLLKWTPRKSPADARDAVMEKTTHYLGRIFGSQAPRAGRAVAALIVGASAAATLAAADTPSMHFDPTPPLPASISSSDLAGKGDSKKSISDQTPSGKADDEPNFANQIERLRQDFELQRDEIYKLNERLSSTKKELITVRESAAALLENLESLGEIAKETARANEHVADSLGTAIDIDRAILERNRTVDSLVVAGLDRVQELQNETITAVGKVTSSLETAGQGVTRAETMLVNTNTVWDDAGFFGRFNPLRQYQVTPFTLHVVRQSARQKNTSPEMEAALDAVEKFRSARRMRAGTFQSMLFELADLEARSRSLDPDAVHRALDEVMPQIIKLSRVPR